MSRVTFQKCPGCGVLVICQDGHPQPHDCDKVIAEKRRDKEARQ